MAGVLADFMGQAKATIDIAIYDFRLLEGPLTDSIVKAANDAVERGVAVRLAYDKKSGPTDATTLKDFADAGGDPAPTGTHVRERRARSFRPVPSQTL
jgi:hypothetical protein